MVRIPHIQSRHNPYFSRWFSAIEFLKCIVIYGATVTILILVDGFLQSDEIKFANGLIECHNPYFSRWFSAIWNFIKLLRELLSHNPYFSRWFSAM